LLSHLATVRAPFQRQGWQPHWGCFNLLYRGFHARLRGLPDSGFGCEHSAGRLLAGAIWQRAASVSPVGFPAPPPNAGAAKGGITRRHWVRLAGPFQLPFSTRLLQWLRHRFSGDHALPRPGRRISSSWSQPRTSSLGAQNLVTISLGAVQPCRGFHRNLGAPAGCGLCRHSAANRARPIVRAPTRDARPLWLAAKAGLARKPTSQLPRADCHPDIGISSGASKQSGLSCSEKGRHGQDSGIKRSLLAWAFTKAEAPTCLFASSAIGHRSARFRDASRSNQGRSLAGSALVVGGRVPRASERNGGPNRSR